MQQNYICATHVLISASTLHFTCSRNETPKMYYVIYERPLNPRIGATFIYYRMRKHTCTSEGFHVRWAPFELGTSLLAFLKRFPPFSEPLVGLMLIYEIELRGVQ